MRFKLKKQEKSKHGDIVSAVGWTSKNELFSVSDDLTLLQWDINGENENKVMDTEVPVLCMDWMPCPRMGGEVLAMGFANGCLKLASKTGRVERSIKDAHAGGIICVKWSYDGAAIATAGEDGQIKLWSRNGEFRASLVQQDKPIYSLCWSPDNNSVLYCYDSKLFIMPTLPGTKAKSWKGGEGVILCVDWNPSNNQIISGGEDCKYRVWDPWGRQLFASAQYEYVITSVKWSPNGQVFGVGAFDMLRLCDKSGWSHSFAKPSTGSLMSLSWSTDGTVIAAAGGNGSVLFGYLVGRSISWGSLHCKVEEDNKIVISDLLHEMNEELDFRDRVVTLSLAYGYLIVATSAQCYVYNILSLNTPVIFDVKETINLVVQGTRHFALVEATNGVTIYNYEGKPLSSPKYSGLRVEFLNSKYVSLSTDVTAILDTSNHMIVRIFDIATGRAANINIDHSLEIQELSLNQVENPSERKIAFVDTNKDLFLTHVSKREIIKVGTMVDCFAWNDRTDMLTCISDGKLITWLYPNSIYVEKVLVQECKLIKEAIDIGKNSEMLSFNGSLVHIRKSDGALAGIQSSPHALLLYEFVLKSNWEKAIRLCRFVKDHNLWAALAAMSIYYRELNTAEIALAAIDQVDKVQYINYIKELKSEQSRNAALALYCKRLEEAEQILLQSKLFYRAIKMNIKLFKWERALDIAVQNKTHVDTVLAYRQRHLQMQNRTEYDPKFAEYADKIEINWETIKEKCKKEKDHEAKK